MQTVFKHWLQAQWDGGSAAFELKRTITDRFYIPDLKQHQVLALSQARSGGLYYKIPDDSYGVKPFDCFIIKEAEAYVVIGFGSQLRDFVIIPIDTWLAHTTDKTSVVKSEVVGWPGVQVVPIKR